MCMVMPVPSNNLQGYLMDTCPNEIVNVVSNNRKYEYVINNMMTDTIIVDECSMISQHTFDTINSVCKMKDPRATVKKE